MVEEEAPEMVGGDDGTGGAANLLPVNEILGGGGQNMLKAIQSSSLSMITKRNYLQKGIVLVKLVDKPLDYIIKNPKVVIKIINREYPNVGSRKTFYTFILALFRYNPDLKCKLKKAFAAWSEEFSKCDQTIVDRYKENAPTDKQIEGYVKYEDIVKKRDSLEDGTDEKLLLSMYTYIPPLRADFGKVALYGHGVTEKDRTEANYIYDSSELVLRHYKTAKSHKEFRKELPKELSVQIKKSLEKRKRDYLFTMKDGKPMLRNTFTKWCNRMLERLFERPLTVSLIRHAYINTLDFNKLTIKEKEEIAADMTHTAGMQDKYRLIFTDKDVSK